MTHYNPLLHHRRSIRLKGYDYSLPGAYFVTLVAHQRQPLFCGIADGEMELNPVGMIIHSELVRLPIQFINISLDSFVIMPNHVHAIIVINPVGATRPRLDITQSNSRATQEQIRKSSIGSPLQEIRPSGSTPNSLGTLIGQFKSRATKRIRSIPGLDHQSIWQRNYYEHIIRNQTEMEKIHQYIVENPRMWSNDLENPERIT